MLLLPRGINSGQHNSPRPMNASQDDGDAGSGRPRRDEIAVDGYAVTDTRDQLVVGERPAASVVRGVTDENGGGGGGDCKSRMAGERELNLGTRTSASSDPRERIMFRGTAVSDSPAEAADGMPGLKSRGVSGPLRLRSADSLHFSPSGSSRFRSTNSSLRSSSVFIGHRRRRHRVVFSIAHRRSAQHQHRALAAPR